MALGPVDVIIIGFPGNNFNGDIAPAIMELVDAGTIRVLDLLFVLKDADGVVTGPAFLQIEVTEPGALGSDDADEVADDLPIDSSALLVAFENTWAQRFVGAVFQSGGVVIDSIRIPADVVNAAIPSA